MYKGMRRLCGEQNFQMIEDMVGAQNLVRQYLTFSSLRKRQIVESVFSNLQLNDAILYGNYKLPFAILAENAERPLNYARQDSNLRPSV